jgi:hypothetical protein
MKRQRLLSMVLLVGLTASWALAAGRDEIDVTLRIVDEQGRAIPHATVWGYVLPSRGPLALDANDLWRLTTKYQSSFEFATRFNPIVGSMHIFPMGDRDGKATIKIDYKDLEGSAAQRPAKMSIGFTVMKRGYLPSRIDFTVTRESRISGTVVLKHDRGSTPETQPYLVNFERLRYELSDTSRNENISEKNHQRIERLRAELEASARLALEASDKKAAARIYARMQYLPAIRFINGKPAGFAQSDAYSEQSMAYRENAYTLDPSNPYIAAKFLYDQGGKRFGERNYKPDNASEEQRLAFNEYFKNLHTLMGTYGKEIWPIHHRLYASWHRRSNDPTEREHVIPLLEELCRAEPKFETRENLLRFVR